MAATIGIQETLCVRATITGDATGGDVYTMVRAGQVCDAWVICTATSNGGTVTVLNASIAITDAMACATNKALIRAGTIDDASFDLAVGNALTFTTNGASDRGVVCVEMLTPLCRISTVA